MKFKVDENLPIEVVRLLEDNGHDALTILGQNLGGEPGGGPQKLNNMLSSESA